LRLLVVVLQKNEELIALDGADVGERRGLSSMYFAKLAREFVEEVKMGLKVPRNSVYAGGGVMVSVWSSVGSCFLSAMLASRYLVVCGSPSSEGKVRSFAMLGGRPGLGAIIVSRAEEEVERATVGWYETWDALILGQMYG
jgi:hypothetical protein